MTLEYNYSDTKILNTDKEKKFLFSLDNTIQNKKVITINNAKSSNHIAYTDLKNIYLNFNKVKLDSNFEYKKFLTLIKALNYHEYAHIKYTKYKNSKVPYNIKSELNILEDQRIEGLLTQKYYVIKDYFKLLSNEYIIKKLDYNTYILLYGRRLILENNKLMVKLRFLAVERYGSDKIIKIENIIDKYLVTTNVSKQIDLAYKLNKLIDGQGVLINQTSSLNTSKGSNKKLFDKDEKESIKKLSKNLKEYDKKNVEQKIKPSTKNDVKKEIVDNAKNNIEKVEKITDKDAINQMNSMNKYDFDEDSPFRGNIFTPDNQHLLMSRSLTSKLKFLKTDLGNKTIRRQKRGRIDLRSAMRNRDSYKLTDFKRYIPSRLNKTRIGVSIIIDSSGSMNDKQSNTAFGCAWSISSALENTNSETIVYEFARNTRKIKDFNETVAKAKWRKKCCGETNVSESLKYSFDDFKNLKLKKDINNNLLIVLTDGCFSDSDELVIKNIKSLKSIGVRTVFINVSRSNSQNSYFVSLFEKFGFDDNIFLSCFSELGDSISKVIRSYQATIVRRIKF